MFYSGGSIKLETIFTDSDDLVSLIESYLRLGQNIASMWTGREVDAAKVQLRDRQRGNN